MAFPDDERSEITLDALNRTDEDGGWGMYVSWPLSA